MTTDSGRITEKRARQLLVNEKIETLSLDDLLSHTLKDHSVFRPYSDFQFSVDPRSTESIIYNPARAKRPHHFSNDNIKKKTIRETCPICAGETTGIIDLAFLSDGFTFINRNLFPVIHPPGLTGNGQVQGQNPPWGFHLVQWSSSIHDQDWHNMVEEDCVIVMSRLAAAEKKLFNLAQEIREKLKSGNEHAEDETFISVIKNTGSAVGGSLEHGHQQILLSNLTPRRLRDNQKFEAEHGITFSKHLQESNPSELLVRDYDCASLIISKYMRRPLEMILVLKDTKKAYLHELNEGELLAVSRGWTDGTRAIRKLMPDMDKEIAFNIVTHNGRGAGLYFEFLPYTQETGGVEQLGLSVCQADPFWTADHIRETLKG
jgi:galactose-1-phosphate uridylyltransferase